MADVKMLLESAKFGDLSDFLRARDSGEIIAQYIIDKGNQINFFNNIPGLIAYESDLSKGPGDTVKVKQANVVTGVGLPGPASATRQLAGSEAKAGMAFREQKVSVGIHRYAVAVDRFDKGLSADLLPKELLNQIFGSLANWWSETDDYDTFCTLFRDYPPYYAEINSISSDAESMLRIDSLFGRGTCNNVGSTPEVLMPDSKTDIEPDATGSTGLDDGDTLNDTFITSLQEYCEQEIGMPPIAMEDEKAVYGLFVEQSDIAYFHANSSSTFKANLLESFSGKGFMSPVWSKVLGEYAGIRFFKWGAFAPKDNKNIIANYNSIYKGLRGTPLNPQAKILAYAVGGNTIAGLSEWQGGDIATRGIGATATSHFLILSHGAANLPYFDPSGSTTIGADSINKAVVGATQAGYDYCTVAENDLVGRFQIGQGTTATTKWKVDYVGPVYVGTMLVGAQNGENTFIDNAYRVQIVGLHKWNVSDGKFDAALTDADTTLSTAITALKAFLGITTNVILTTSAYQTRTYEQNRRVHLFDTVRSIVFGSGMMLKANAGGANYAEETRDYGNTQGKGMTVVQGKKLNRSGHGLINSYAIVAFKRPAKTM
jgi:hypothetical protein